MMTARVLLEGEFGTIPDLIRLHAAERPDAAALAMGGASMTYRRLNREMDRVAAGLQRDGIAKGDAVAIVSATSIPYAVAFLGILRAGAAVAPLAPSSTPDSLAAMIRDCGARIVFADEENTKALEGQPVEARIIRLDDSAAPRWADWLPVQDTAPDPVAIGPDDPFNIIYSSGTTGTPRGIVQPHKMRWAHVARNAAAGFDTAVTMVATPLYSNTTLVSLFPTLAWGGTAVLMGKFEARAFLESAERWRATHAMLVPVQYSRIMSDPEFDRFDLSGFRLKTCTSAPFSATLKADVVARWPGLLVEYYGMTEGGGTCALVANQFPDKLHTVGRPVDGHDIRLIDDDGNEVPQGEMGEVVGRSPAMMSGYHGRKDATDDAAWFDARGNRYFRLGDVGRFDEDGFLTLLDRKKDLIISGGFNIYPSDLEGVLAQHPAVADCSVIGMPSDAWGETPVGFYVPRGDTPAETILAETNAKLGKTQRLSALYVIDQLPRSAIGKVLKRELRDKLEETA